MLLPFSIIQGQTKLSDLSKMDPGELHRLNNMSKKQKLYDKKSIFLSEERLFISIKIGLKFKKSRSETYHRQNNQI